MKASRGIAAVVLSVMACALAWGNSEVDGPPKPSFGQYYEAYKTTVEPNAPGYSLPLSVRDIGNYEQVSSSLGLSDVEDLLEQNGFAVVEHAFGLYDPNRDTITGPYGYLASQQKQVVAGTEVVEILARTAKDSCSVASDVVDRALCELAAEDRELLTLKHLDGLSYKELAERLEIPIGTVMSRLYYARKKFRQSILTLQETLDSWETTDE